jgi:predicted transcriptional regulator
MPSKAGKILKALGLTEGEVNTYLAALRLGPSSVLDLSNATGLTRQSTYNATQRLTDFGLLESSIRNNISIFTAEKPSKLLEYAECRQKELNTMIDDLRDLIPDLDRQAGGDKPAIKIMEGKGGMLEAVNTIINCGGEGGYELVDFSAVREMLAPGAFEKMQRIITKRSTRDVTAIYTKDASQELEDVVSRLITVPHEDEGFRTVVCAFEDKIVFVSFQGKVYTIVIEDKLLASTMRMLFKHACGDICRKKSQSNQ